VDLKNWHENEWIEDEESKPGIEGGDDNSGVRILRFYREKMGRERKLIERKIEDECMKNEEDECMKKG